MATGLAGHSFRSVEETEPTPTRSGGERRFFFGSPGGEQTGPEGFLVDCEPGHEIDSHFHRIDQFQVMLGEEGSYYQRHPMSRALLHYTDAYSVYGPFGSGPNAGMRFFTLRAEPSDIHASMPQSRDLLLYRGRRHHQIDLAPLLDEPASAAGISHVQTLIGPDSDGLAAHLLRLAPGAVAAPPAGELRTGRYSVVLEGEVDQGGRRFGQNALGWSAGEVTDVELTGGPSGAAVLFLHMPYPATPTVQAASA